MGGAGLPLAISPVARYEAMVIPFPPGSQLSLYSDALIDAPDTSGEPLGEEWVVGLVRDVLADDPAETVVGVMAGFAARSPGEFADDVTWVQVVG